MQGAGCFARAGARLGALAAFLLCLGLPEAVAARQGISCASFHTQEDAQAVYEANLRNGAGDRFDLDPDGDGIACDEVPTRDGRPPDLGGDPAPAPTPGGARGSYHFPDPREADIDRYWQRSFAAAERVYASPNGLLPVGPVAFRDACGGSRDRGHYAAFYCAADSTVYYDEEAEAWVTANYGEVAWTFVMAHEWGHHVQFLLDPFTGLVADPVMGELQADCLAGAYFADALARRWIDEAGVDDEVLPFLLDSGDPETHGTGPEQVDAFTRGLADGPPGCDVSL